MFGLFKRDPTAKLRKQYAAKLEQAVEAQRSGKIPHYAELMAESEEIAQRIDALERGH